MNEIIIIAICIIALIIVKISINIKFKSLKDLNKRGTESLKDISKKFPKDEEICEKILDKLNAKDVEVKINEDYDSCLYTVFNNTITIGKFKEQYMKIQTIAHECIHASQNKKTLWANFIISNIYNLFFYIIIVLTLFNKIVNTNIYIYILTMLGIIQYIIRSNLENDAMLNAKYIAKEYLEETKVLSKEENDELLKEYEEVNKIGIPFINFTLIQGNLIKVIIFCIIALI